MKHYNFYWPHRDRKGALTPVLQVLLTLRYYECGSFQDVCRELVGVHQTITHVMEALLPLASEWIRFPTQAEADKSKAKLYRKAAFPKVFGCIDGTQIRIQSHCTARNEHEYVNRTNYHSINVQPSISRHACPAVRLTVWVLSKQNLIRGLNAYVARTNIMSMVYSKDVW